MRLSHSRCQQITVIKDGFTTELCNTEWFKTNMTEADWFLTIKQVAKTITEVQLGLLCNHNNYPVD